eukprot:CAMPEP_0185911066 /NCGR_PEP_ID=MMETSP0196C-20130402/24368_1 /TAXON_ID=2932 /ORGANISM="Alexandrium fundyense, Strain CCMP1719" /LENGTH=52 /DNA_ID=CAMNT_0028631995 /DNA_START=13 /DNA_END=168 /DNA_ORIENTATION=+
MTNREKGKLKATEAERVRGLAEDEAGNGEEHAADDAPSQKRKHEVVEETAEE